MLAHPQPLRNLRNRIASLRDLTHRVTLELVAEIRFAHNDLLASKLGKKASKNLGAIQLDGIENQIRSSNELSTEDRERSLVEIDVIKELLKPSSVRVDAIKGFVVPALIFIAGLLAETIGGAAISNIILPHLKSLLPSVFSP